MERQNGWGWPPLGGETAGTYSRSFASPRAKMLATKFGTSVADWSSYVLVNEALLHDVDLGLRVFVDHLTDQARELDGVFLVFEELEFKGFVKRSLER